LYFFLIYFFFWIKTKRKVRHQGESETSQLGWHPTETPILYRLPIHIIKNKGKNMYKRGGTRPRPSENKKSSKIKDRN